MPPTDPAAPNSSINPVPSAGPVSPTARGRQAETLAAAYLARHGYTILDRNWRNRWCELDIVARRGSAGQGATTWAPNNYPALRTPGAHPEANEVHFIEVKYRRTTAYGYAAEYISRDKQARLIRAAAAWCQAHHYTGPYQISVVTVEGDLAAPVITYLPGVISG